MRKGESVFVAEPVPEIARRYAEFVHVFEAARAS